MGEIVIRPWGMAVWDELRDDLNRRVWELGVRDDRVRLMSDV